MWLMNFLRTKLEDKHQPNKRKTLNMYAKTEHRSHLAVRLKEKLGIVNRTKY